MDRVTQGKGARRVDTSFIEYKEAVVYCRALRLPYSKIKPVH